MCNSCIICWSKVRTYMSICILFGFLVWVTVTLLLHWNGNVIILTKFSSLAALKVVILTTFGAASDENFIKMMTFSFQCLSPNRPISLASPLLVGYCCVAYHDDVMKWKHFPRYGPFVRGIHRSPVNSPHKGQCREAFMFSLICVWINGWVNNREAGDLRRHRAHNDVFVMF